MAAQDCIDEIKGLLGKEASDDDVLRILEAIEQRRKLRAAKNTLESYDESLSGAAKEIADEALMAAAIEKRNAAMNLIKRVSRREFYEGAPNLTLGLEAKLSGVNTPFAGSRFSVDAQYKALRRDYVSGLAVDLDRASLFETAKSGVLDRDMARELFELSRTEGKGNPGVTGNKQALAIAEVVHKYQRLAVDGLNKAGAWIGQYDGYIARTSHDPDRIRRAGYEAWKNDILPRLDEKTFEGVEDIDKFLNGVYSALVTGVHLTQEGSVGFKAPAFKGPGNIGKRLSQGRVLHFKDADSWMDYQSSYGRGTLIENVLRSLDFSARNTALMREFGTNPRAEFDQDIRHLKEKHRDDHAAMEKLRRAEKKLQDQFGLLDGTANMPVNLLAARIGSGWRAIQAMSKLGGIVLSAIGDIPLKAAELKYQGIGFLDGYADGLASVARGRGTGATKDVADLMRAGTDGMVGDLAARFDASDTVPGTMAKIQNTFFRFTGIKYWTDAQRAGAELVMARHLAKQSGLEFKKLPEETSRLLTMFGISADEWNAVRSVDLKQADGRSYLTPDSALKIEDFTKKQREELALKLHAYYADRGQFAVIEPGTRERAMLTWGLRPGTAEGEAIRALMQFKAFPVAVITKAWGREVYGGNSGFGAVAGLTHMLVASIAFGYMAMSAKDIAKGRTPRDPKDPATLAAAFVQGGGAGIFGDFIMGEYNRFGRGFLATAGGPTASLVEDVVDLWNRAKRGDDTAAPAFKMLMANVPFVNLAYTRMALDYLLMYQISEALNPGYLRRMERNVKEKNDQTFIIPPSSAIPYGGGSRVFEGVR
jgi:hypothetical protein